MAIRKTPDVYVEEISIFPPSVAEVETAIPAFIGYTEKATKISTDDLLNKPTRISSMLDFEKYYGGGPETSVDSITLDDSNNFKSAVIDSKYFLYDSIRLFYNNGGGDCYIVSVGYYPSSISDTELQKGLDSLEKYDEPTIILFPDAVNLSTSKLATLQANALSQCAKLMDRVAVFDVKKHNDSPVYAYEAATPIQDFRDNVGINNLKYGMAYTPWLKVAMNKNISYDNVKDIIYKQGQNVFIEALTTSSAIQAQITAYDSLLSDKAKVTAAETSLYTASFSTLRQYFNSLVDDYNGATSDVAKFKKIMKLMFDTAATFDDWADGGASVILDNAELNTIVSSGIASTLTTSFTDMVKLDNECVSGTASEAPDTAGITGYTSQFSSGSYSSGDWGTTWSTSTDMNAFVDTASNSAKMLAVVAKVKVIFEKVNEVLDNFLSSVKSLENTYETSLLESYPLYKAIITGVKDSATIMPPSGAVVGIYAAVDRERGVWKAPANVSINSVIAPTDIYTASELDDLNIDVNAGKSVNAIRAFTGKGTLIWGARTLAGNDNEWRYIPVRRFYNTVEESIKKSTYWAVFEPNNANTWVKVKGMIENYLTLKWREGALVGAKPDDAFFVRIGLGVTMTAQDILNGYMNVEIGMAVVRPAEFIVLKFSHKQQVS